MTKSRLLPALLFMLVFSTAQIAASYVYAEEAAEGAKEAPKADAKDASKDGDKKPTDVSGGKFAGDPIYVHISPMVLPVINENGVEQLVTVILDVEVKNFDAADEMHSHMPKIMDSLMRKLYGNLGTGKLKNGKLADVSRIKARSIDAIGEVIGPENVNDVLVQSVAQRML